MYKIKIFLKDWAVFSAQSGRSILSWKILFTYRQLLLYLDSGAHNLCVSKYFTISYLKKKIGVPGKAQSGEKAEHTGSM